jgi:phenylalanyl-tRNA synthetase alpha chain
MLKKLEEIGQQTLSELTSIDGLDALEALRLRVLGKKGSLSEVLRGLGSVGPAERPLIGAKANEIKATIETAIEARKAEFQKHALSARLASEKIDVTLPARQQHRGALHPVTTTIKRLREVFASMGFEIALGPEVETDYLNFEAVNIPADHPARDMQDTFFMGPGVVLRTHTSAVQMRTMRSQELPIRVICPGAVYRCDSDATHLPMFHQIEGLWVDRGVRMSDLKGVLAQFAREMFGTETKVRLRPSYFQFVEPGAEVDVSCFSCRSKPVATCRICKGTGWLEILGAGMVHPRLFEMAGETAPAFKDFAARGLTGFAFGMGVERIAMLLHKIPDLRLLYQGDPRFLRQFSGGGA